MNITVESMIDLSLGKVTNFFSLGTWLILSPALLSILYSFLRQQKFFDILTGRDQVILGIERLKNTSGFPINWIYNNKIEDEKIFKQLFIRIKKNSKEPKMKMVLAIPHCPVFIATAGSPIPIDNLDPELPQSARFFYSENHPVLYCFSVRENGNKKQKGLVVCSLKDLDIWIKNEKEQLDFWIGSFIISILSMVLIIVRLAVISSH